MTTVEKEFNYLIARAQREKDPKLEKKLVEAKQNYLDELATRPRSRS